MARGGARGEVMARVDARKVNPRRPPAIVNRGQRKPGATVPPVTWRAVSGPAPMLEIVMLGWAITFLIIALIAALLGFSGLAVISVEIAQILFVVFFALFLISLIVRAVRGRPPPV